MIWGGIVNDSRSLARNLVAYSLDNHAAKELFAGISVSLCSDSVTSQIQAR